MPPWRKTTPAADKKQIEARVNDFFVALQKRDTTLMRQLALPEADVWTVRRVNDSLITRSRTVADDMRRLATNPQVIPKGAFGFCEIRVKPDI